MSLHKKKPWARTWALHNNERRPGDQADGALAQFHAKQDATDGEAPKLNLWGSFKKYSFLGWISPCVLDPIPCPTSLLLHRLIFPSLCLSNCCVLPSFQGRLRRGGCSHFLPLNSIILSLIILVGSNWHFCPIFILPNDKTTYKLGVLYSRENNPWTGGVQCLTSSGTPLPRDFGQEWAEEADRKQSMTG